MITIILGVTISVILVLSLCVIYLLYVYRKLLDKYADISIKTDRNEIHKKIKIDVNQFINQKVDNEINKATENAVSLITKNAESVAKSIRKKTIEQLTSEVQGEEHAVAAEYDAAKLEVEKYKAQKFEEIRKKTNEILARVVEESLIGSLDSDKEAALISKALENAKRSNIF